ncbi:hypothetical protein [Chitinophaga sp. CF418]|uniref:hypothetical protein n=1 Tax=Chitinophaga sp. CF418 TaxID=1855287 RepID=UPI00092036F9|nr:hypothetical protein [Chitinophaga sp. CF418]SHN43876.1 hypothetical protein SAMN05216311_116107 [Chitinophaga sp. CF418]
MDADTTPNRNWAYIFSPCVVLAIISVVIAGIYTLAPAARSEEGAYMILAILFLLPCSIISLLIDQIVRFCLTEVKKKAQYIWVIEVMLIVFVFALFFFLFGL